MFNTLSIPFIILFIILRNICMFIYDLGVIVLIMVGAILGLSIISAIMNYLIFSQT